ncbi:MAG: cytidyltransferase, partial [Candidatus Atribacteria bacterium]|nr:cytidyltransferase [Candidatus Atribacteria bacterium]
MEMQKKDNDTKNEVAGIFKNLTQLESLKKVGVEFRDIHDLEKDTLLVEKLSQMVERKELSAKQTLELYWDKFHSIDSERSQEQWLKQIYHFCQFLSFPNTRPECKDISLAESKWIYLFLFTYRQIVHLQEKNSIYPFVSQYPLVFLSKKEIDLLEQPQEYQHFLSAFDQLFVYEMMALSREIYHYNTIDHVCGVHSVALSLARQIKKQGISLDLGIVSGSSAGHDIGKYGCRVNEIKRVPYLHYYYTDLWFKRQNIAYIGHIAVNHSVWDLELENLSLESLILIYSDFRVKNIPDLEKMNIYSLHDAFEIILKKLDYLDEKKEKRYRRVFSKLKDFEDFCVEHGVNVNLVPFAEKKYRPVKKQHYLPLLFGDEVVQKIKHLS